MLVRPLKTHFSPFLHFLWHVRLARLAGNDKTPVEGGR